MKMQDYDFQLFSSELRLDFCFEVMSEGTFVLTFVKNN